LDPLLTATHGDVPREVFGAVLVLCRVSAAVATMPALGDSTMPMTIRASVAIVLTAVVIPLVFAHVPALPRTGTETVVMVVFEVATGLFLGWTAQIAALALPVAAQIISVVTGLTSVINPDPELGAQTSALGRIFNLAVPVALFSTGLFALPLQALVGSYRIVGFGGHLAIPDTMHAALTVVAASFALSLRLAAPFLAAGMLWHVTVGLVGRFVPTMGAQAVVAPGQIIGGLVLLAIFGASIMFGWESGFRQIYAASLGMTDGG
jgi:flagellar biosynthesis protein FliR